MVRRHWAVAVCGLELNHVFGRATEGSTVAAPEHHLIPAAHHFLVGRGPSGPCGLHQTFGSLEEKDVLSQVGDV